LYTSERGPTKRFWCGTAFGLLLFAGQRIPQLENDDVKVWKSVIVPNAPLTMHRHDHGRVIVALQGGTIKIVDQGGSSEQNVWDSGKAYWLPANAPNTMHADVNAGGKPIEEGQVMSGGGCTPPSISASVRGGGSASQKSVPEWRLSCVLPVRGDSNRYFAKRIS
jgi:hypothetical protein